MTPTAPVAGGPAVDDDDAVRRRPVTKTGRPAATTLQAHSRGDDAPAGGPVRDDDDASSV